MNFSIFNFSAWRLAIGVVLVFFATEVAFRFIYFGMPAIFSPRLYTPQSFPDARWVEPDPNPLISFRMKSNQDTVFKGARFRTNSLGFRGSEVLPKDDPDQVRIATLGRSGSLGSGVSDEEVYSERLNTWFESDGRPVEVFNLSVGAYTLAQVAETYRSYKTIVAPDLLILPISLLDVNSTIASLPRKFEPRRFDWLEIRSYFSDSFLYRLVRSYSREFMVAAGLNHDWNWRWRALKNKHLKRDSNSPEPLTMHEFLEEFFSELRRDGVEVIVLVMRRTNEYPFEREIELASKLRGWFRQHTEVSVIDTLDWLRGRVSRADSIYPGDPHPNAKVHCYLAAVVYDALEKRFFPHESSTAEELVESRCRALS
jgi:hypothetical protein